LFQPRLRVGSPPGIVLTALGTHRVRRNGEECWARAGGIFHASIADAPYPPETQICAFGGPLGRYGGPGQHVDRRDWRNTTWSKDGRQDRDSILFARSDGDRATHLGPSIHANPLLTCQELRRRLV